MWSAYWPTKKRQHRLFRPSSASTYLASHNWLHGTMKLITMRIGIVCPYDVTKGGGVQEIVKSQLEGLRARGHEVYLITPRPPKHDGLPVDRVIFVGGSSDLRSPGSTTVQVSAGLANDIE